MWDKPRALNWIANLLNALAAVMFLYGLVYVVVHLPIFPLKEVRVEGTLEHVTREQIKLIADRHLQGNFFTVDVVKARDAFQKLPWARKVSVRKRWPDRLEVVIEEQRELARWGNIALVNTYGELFHAASDSDLPVFYGPGDGVAEVAKQYGVYSQILGTGTGMHIAQLALTPRRAWQIKTSNGMVIELGREEMETRLQKFASVYGQTLGGLKVAINYADLRYPNGFAVRKPEGSTPKRKTGAA
ncbi:cell division protein FtsQ/DivIB [Methylobacillus sp. Pita2]|uniref:cell division protein FtsQ/DivIB n=1 Tax=Methylobacillus TaxID=404 RepID=UPI002853FBAC|nr:cell division protein FtsQ/DivIB [Methylobacillus flagellatus]MDR5172345.1 cell division protein FtsQ/DivIB [Methylobacillus flagellatus]